MNPSPSQIGQVQGTTVQKEDGSPRVVYHGTKKDFDTFDFTALPGLSKPKVLELGRCEWIEQKSNCCLVGSHGTGKPRPT